MARLLRLEFSCALYHVTARGDGREAIYLSDGDRRVFLELLIAVCERFNRSYNRTGHVFQGRYKAILVQKDAYLLELARYVVLNPVRA